MVDVRLGRRFAIAFFGALVAASVLPEGTARAQHTEVLAKLSPYEEETLDSALAHTKSVVDPSPEGKTLEAIDVVALEVIEERDPAPRFLNVFHATTKESVIRNEILLAVGAQYCQYRIDESVRALRSFQQISLVLVVALVGSTPDKVRLLVVTKDVWSLRAQFDIRLGQNGLDRLRLEPTERNIGGTLNSAVTRLDLLPESLTLGAGYYMPRILGKKLQFVSDVNVVLNRESGAPEGTYGAFGIFTPLLSVDTPWIWSYGVLFSNVVVRRYVGARLAAFDDPSTTGVEAIPDAYRQRTMTQTAGLLRSFGRAHKTDVSFGAEVNVRDYRGLDPNVVGPDVAARYAAARIPTSENRAGPFAQVRAYEGRFVRLHDFDLLALGEDHRVGYDAYVRVYPVTRAMGSTRDFVGANAFAQYVVSVGDGLFRAGAETLLEADRDGFPGVAVAGTAAAVSPRTPLGRVVFDAVAIQRPENVLNQRNTLGGEGRLRGYPSAAFLGRHVIAWNTELRTRPVEILSCQLAGVAFHDVGDAYDGTASLKSSVGFGVRTLFPQLDRKVFRIDVAFPLIHTPAQPGVPATSPIGFYVAFEQAFPASPVLPPGTVASQAILNALGAALGQ